MMAYALLYWRQIAVLVVVAILGGGLLWYRGEAAQCEAKSAELLGAYTLLAEKVKEQNAATLEWERRAKEAQARSAKAAAKARQQGVRLASRAEAADRAIRMPLPVPAECPAAAGVMEARALLRAEPKP